MAKPGESRRISKLTRSRNVSSFFEESTESATPPKTTLSVVADVHTEAENPNRQRRRRGSDENNHSGDKETRRSSEISKASSRASEASRDRSSGRGTRNSSRDRSRHSHDDLTVESLDLIEEFTTSKKMESPEEKPRRRKQWSTVASLANEVEADAKRLPRKRWLKDAGIIRLPETKDASPLIDAPRRLPVPAPRSSVRQSVAASFHFDNPAFVSENEDEVLRIETDHNRESTRIEMRRLSDRSSGSSGLSRKHRKDVADSDDRSSRTKSSASRRDSVEEQELSGTSASLERITDLRTSSIASEARSGTSERKSRPEARRDRSSRKEERLFKKKEPPSDEIVSSSARNVDSATKTSTETRVRKKKKRKRKQEKEEAKEKGEMKYVSVTVHRADVLEADYVSAKRPMVRVHIVEARTGSYLKTSTASNRENAHLQPMITGKFDFKENRSMIPVWEEELIFEHDFDEIVRREDGDQVVILFEVIDLLSFAEASLSYDRVGNEGCWNKIAWAFLKPIGNNNVQHVDKKVRLQLYKPKRNFKRYGKHKCEVYTWWQSNNRDKYPSSLLVTVTSVPPPKCEPVLYQQLPLHEILGDTRNDSRIPSTRTSDSIGLPKWARMAAQSCKIPNERMFETETSENGCFYVAFSNDGKYLACAHSEEYNYPIVVYEVESGKIHVRFLGHKTFVYSLSWSSDDRHLLSASADQTARIWDVRDQIIQHIEMLPHPSYVYCATYGPGKTTIVATGCYDRVARIWAGDRKSRKRELSQELEGHEGFVNSMVFQKNGNLITADSVGSIILWTARRNSRIAARREWRSERKIKVREIEGVVINTIALHPLESRLLVHSRDNGLRMLDLATGVVLQKYRQLHNRRIQAKACISPCGGLILCGGEDSTLNIWNLETGKYVARYSGGRSLARVVVACVDYHPYDHVLAFSTFGNPSAVSVLKFNKNVSDNDVGLNLIDDASQARGNEIILNVLEHPPSRQSKSSGGKAGSSRKASSSSNRPAADPAIQIEDNNPARPWTKLRRLKEMERSWEEKGQSRLYRIIRKIDSLLSKKSMFPEDVIGGKWTSSANDGKNSWIDLESGVSSPDARDVSRSQDPSSDFHDLAALFETAAPSRKSSLESAGTYVIEMPEFENKIAGIRSEDVESGQTYGSSSSHVSNTTFVIENERT
ncbi:jouberin-like [Linepithema humile]|uniref:jouberin-like n=1 Tax=Linepithema humile TaxID=83485 RepID=UPI00351F76FF